MEMNSSQEPIEKETKDESAKATSSGKKSRKTESMPTDLNTLLRILQQSLYNYQEGGGKLVFPDVGNVGTAVVLLDVDMSDVGSLSLRPANIANTQTPPPPIAGD